MKIGPFLLAIGIVAAASPARGGEDGQAPSHPRTEVDGKTLSATEVQHYFAPYGSDVRGCFLRRAAGGKFSLDLIIHRDGSVFRAQVATPSLSRRAGRAVDACVQKLARSWHFPMRAGFTHAVVPFYLQKTNAPGAGPQPGCRSPRGCLTRR
jgi:hypothetical protein